MATLYLSGGGLGRSAQAWPEALHWLAAQPGPLLLASIASDDDRQARTLQQLLAAVGREATLISHLPQESTEPTTLDLLVHYASDMYAWGSLLLQVVAMPQSDWVQKHSVLPGGGPYTYTEQRSRV
jgi:hypothetical protein